jgi:hypothetical protein
MILYYIIGCLSLSSGLDLVLCQSFIGSMMSTFWIRLESGRGFSIIKNNC